MRDRLLALFAALAVTTMLAATPAAAETGTAASQQSPGALVAPVQSGVGDYWSSGCGCGTGGFSGSMPFGGFGFPGASLWPWWAGMPLGAISAASGFTWPWAPWYWTPQWWTLAALSH